MAKDKLQRQPNKDVLQASATACLKNGHRLYNEATLLEFEEPASTKLALSMIAQEEYAKAFLLELVRADVIPWSRYLLRAMNDHACKHLVGIVIEYLDFRWETWDEAVARIKADVNLGGRVPPDVASALNILRHEKIGRWQSGCWVWSEEPRYESAVVNVAKGKRDKIKQRSLYVRITSDASVKSTPAVVSADEIVAEYQRADRYGRFVESFIERGEKASVFYEKVRDGLRLIFENQVPGWPAENAESQAGSFVFTA